MHGREGGGEVVAAAAANAVVAALGDLLGRPLAAVASAAALVTKALP